MVLGGYSGFKCSNTSKGVVRTFKYLVKSAVSTSVLTNTVLTLENRCPDFEYPPSTQRRVAHPAFT
eukprot:6521437-Prymnesium_polylepis.1